MNPIDQHPKFVVSKDVVAGKNVLLRLCLNVITSSGEINDIQRLQASAKSVKQILELGAKKVTIIAHAGRPEGKYAKELSFRNIEEEFTKELGQEYQFLESIDDNDQTATTKTQITLLENMRFWKAEESDSESERKEFAKELATFGEVFINDAFPDYRVAASTFEIAKLLPSYIGNGFYEEIYWLNKLKLPNRPYLAIMGGAKLSDKLDLAKSILRKVDKLFVGGAMAYTFLAAQGKKIGKSLYEPEKLQLAKELLNEHSKQIILPMDHTVLPVFEKPTNLQNLSFSKDENIDDGMIGVDIGPKTVEYMFKIMSEYRTILWNGPLGVTEWELAATGTLNIAKAVCSQENSMSIVGGGDSLTFINEYKLGPFTHVSLGGGAMLSYISESNFPTLDVIKNKN